MKYLTRWTAVMMGLLVTLGVVTGAGAQAESAQPAQRERKEMFRQRGIIVINHILDQNIVSTEPGHSYYIADLQLAFVASKGACPI